MELSRAKVKSGRHWTTTEDGRVQRSRQVMQRLDQAINSKAQRHSDEGTGRLALM